MSSGETSYPEPNWPEGGEYPAAASSGHPAPSSKGEKHWKALVKFTARAQTGNASGQWETFHSTPHGIAATAAKSLQWCLTLCDPIDGSPPGSSVPGILQTRILEWVAISFSNACMHAKLLQSCLTLCNPMDRANQAPLSMEFSMQEYWSALPLHDIAKGLLTAVLHHVWVSRKNEETWIGNNWIWRDGQTSEPDTEGVLEF